LNREEPLRIASLAAEGLGKEQGVTALPGDQPENDQRGNEAAASVVLLAAALAALVFANSPLSPLYKYLLGIPIELRVGDFVLEGPLKEWIKEGLMAVFFLLVGLEIKWEFTEGSLTGRKQATLPFVTAAAGMAAPALIYFAVASGNPATIHGWAIPSATDIAFAIGVMGLLGRRVPAELKALLLAIAIIDDLGAILIIALFYTAEINLPALSLALIAIIGLAALNGSGAVKLRFYLVVGALLWLCLMKSGVSATLAGVMLALFIPLKGEGQSSPLHDLAKAIQWPVAFIIMPVFAFAYAGVDLGALGFGGLGEPVTAGIALGLVLGKPLGIVLAAFIAVRLGITALPEGVNWGQMIGLGFLAGIGFTMSLFIGVLAFADEGTVNLVRLGVLAGSVTAALMGAAILAYCGRRSSPSQ
jgi:NhaA family Na+:H+ antiporter